MQLTPLYLPGKSHGQRSVTGHSSWGHKESDTNDILILGIHSTQFINRNKMHSSGGFLTILKIFFYFIFWLHHRRHGILFP